MLLSERATDLATFLSANSTHPSVKRFVADPPALILFFLAPFSVRVERDEDEDAMLSNI